MGQHATGRSDAQVWTPFVFKLKLLVCYRFDVDGADRGCSVVAYCGRRRWGFRGVARAESGDRVLSTVGGRWDWNWGTLTGGGPCIAWPGHQVQQRWKRMSEGLETAEHKNVSFFFEAQMRNRIPSHLSPNLQPILIPIKLQKSLLR